MTRISRNVISLFLAIVLAISASAQTPEEHASHHPAGAADGPPATEPATASPSGMEGMGTSPPKELFPSMIELADATPEQRVELERLARARMLAGAELMASGVERLNSAATDEDFASMREAAERTRDGVLQFESGVATLQAIAEGAAPREIALDWFRKNMGMQIADQANPHGFFGLTAFHYFTMLVFAAVAATLIWTNFRKMQRAQALVARLAGDSQTTVLPIASPVPAAEQPRQATPTVAEVPSRQNSWTGLLRVARIFEETPNVRTLRLVELGGGEVPFRHLPGQFVTFTVKPIDETVRRSYTISSSPTHRDYCEVTIKREERGTVSSFLHHVHEGDTLQVTGPSGLFTFIGEDANSIVLIAGGVGITPMMSVLRFLTDRSWAGDIFFIYGCRSDRDVIYREELEYLARRFPNLHLTIVANEVASDLWPHARGNITQELLAKAIPHIQTRRIHLCGPPPMMAAMKSSLAEMGVPAEQIKSEVFIGKERPASTLATDSGLNLGPATDSPDEAAAPPAVAVATFARSKRTALLPPNKTVLEAAEDVGVNIEYSCRVGVCGLCKVKLLSGAVTMEVQDGLDAQEKQNGIILACQARSATDLSVDA